MAAGRKWYLLEKVSHNKKRQEILMYHNIQDIKPSTFIVLHGFSKCLFLCRIWNPRTKFLYSDEIRVPDRGTFYLHKQQTLLWTHPTVCLVHRLPERRKVTAGGWLDLFLIQLWLIPELFQYFGIFGIFFFNARSINKILYETKRIWTWAMAG